MPQRCTWSRSIDQNPGFTNAENTDTQNSHSVDPNNLDARGYLVQYYQQAPRISWRQRTPQT